jgi:Rrf2 family transcriptional regulator, iron-sulfur cluster assembly transcription factor
MPLLARRGILALAAVADIAINRGRPLSAKTLAARYGVPARHFEPVLQALAHHGIVKGVRGPRGGYKLGRERARIAADQIVEAAGLDAEGRWRAPSQHVLEMMLMPALAEAERAFSAALARITLDDLVRRAHNVLKPPGNMPRVIQAPSDSGRQAKVALLVPAANRQVEGSQIEGTWGRWPSTKASGSNR